MFINFYYAKLNIDGPIKISTCNDAMLLVFINFYYVKLMVSLKSSTCKDAIAHTIRRSYSNSDGIFVGVFSMRLMLHDASFFFFPTFPVGLYILIFLI